MAKVDLANVGYVPSSAATINNNNVLIEQAVENTLSRDGTGPNEMNANLDMNNNRIYNLPYPASTLEPMRKTDAAGLLEEMKDIFVGPQGPKGDKGDTGPVGPQGLPGTNIPSVEILSDLATTAIPPEESVIYISGYGLPGVGSQYRRRVASANVATEVDALGSHWELSEAFVTPEMYGNDIQKSMDVAAYLSKKWIASPKTYVISTLTIPHNLEIQADGAVFSREGTIPARSTFIQVGDNVTADTLTFEFDGSERGSIAASALVRIGDYFTCNRMSLTSAIQIGYAEAINGVISGGTSTKIGHIFFKNLDYGLVLMNPSTTTLARGSEIGVIEMESFLRAFYAQFCSFKCAGIRAIGRSPSAALLGSDGENGRYQSNLYEGCEDFEMGDIYMIGCGHGVRIGGSPHANATTRNGRFGNIYLKATRGCAFKINTTRTVSPGVTEKAYNITVGDVTSVDGADGTYEGNREFIRLSHVVNIKFGQCRAIVEDQTYSHQSGLLLNDATQVEIDSLHGDNFNAGFVTFSGTADAPTFPGDIKNIVIGRMTGKMAGSNVIAVDSALNYGDISISFDGLSGFTRIFAWFTSGVLDGNLYLSGWVGGSTAPAYLNLPSDSRVKIDLSWANYRTLTESVLNITSYTIPSVVGNKSQLYLTGIGPNLGNGVSRGAMIEGVNTSGGSNAYDMVLYTNPASAALAERLRITSIGRVGIGTASPGTEVEIADIGGDQDTRLTLRANVSHSAYLGCNTVSLTFDAGTGKSINFRTDGVSRATLSSGGVFNFASTPTVGGSNTVYHTGNLNLIGTIIQSTYSELTTVAAGSNVIPFDDTKPLNTEGFQIMSAVITPASTVNKLRIRVSIPYSLNSAAGTAIAALFVGGTSEALAATFEYRATGTGGQLTLVHEYTPGTTSAQTLTVRVGVDSGSTGIVVNGSGAGTARIFGGASKATLVVDEVKG